MADDSKELEVIFTGNTDDLDKTEREVENRKPVVRVQYEADQSSFGAEGTRARDPATGRFMARQAAIDSGILPSNAGAGSGFDPPPRTPSPSGYGGPDPEDERQRISSQSNWALQSAQTLQSSYNSALLRGDWSAADSTWNTIDQFKFPAGYKGQSFQFSGVGLEGVGHAEYAGMLDTAQSGRQRNYTLSELQSDEPGDIRGWSSQTDQGRTSEAPFNYGLSPQGEAAVSRTTPGIGDKTEAAVDRLVGNIMQEAEAHAEAAKQTERDAEEIQSARRSYRSALNQQDTERQSDFAALDRGAAANFQDSARQDARMFQVGIRGLSRRGQISAIQDRMQALGSGGDENLPPGPNDPAFGEWDSLDRQRNGLEQSGGMGSYQSRRLLYAGIFGAYQLSQSSRALARGDIQSSIATSDTAASQAQLQGIRSASGGLFGQISAEALNLTGFENSPERIEQDITTEASRRTDLDFVRQTQLQIAGATAERTAFQSGGTFAQKAATINAQADQSRLTVQTEVNNLKSNLDARRDVSANDRNINYITQQQVSELTNKLTPLPAGTRTSFQGTDYYLNKEGTLIQQESGQQPYEVNPFQLNAADRETRRAKIAILQAKSANLTQSQQFDLANLQFDQGQDRALTGATLNAYFEMNHGTPDWQAARELRHTTENLARDKEIRNDPENQPAIAAKYLEQQIHEDALEDAHRAGSITRITGRTDSNNLRANRRFFDASVNDIVSNTNAAYDDAEGDPEAQANILEQGQSAYNLNFMSTAYAAGRRSRNLQYATRAASLAHQGRSLDSTLTQLTGAEEEATAQNNDQFGPFAGIANYFTHNYYNTQRKIATEEDSRVQGLRLGQMHDQEQVAKLVSEGLTGTADAKRIQLDAEEQVKALKTTQPNYQEIRRSLLQTAAYGEETLRRSIYNEALQGSFDETVGGTFAPQVSSRPWEEDRQQRMAAAQAAGTALQGQANDPNGSTQGSTPSAADSLSDISTGLKDFFVQFRDIYQLFTSGD